MIRSIDVSAVLRQAVRATYADLVTRATGRAVREHIEQAYVTEILPADVTRMDFTGVRCIDYSCADEIVAKLVIASLVNESSLDAFFMIRGLNDHQMDDVEAVLRRQQIVLVAEVGGAVRLIGEVAEEARLTFEYLAVRGMAAAEELAVELARPLDAVRATLEELYLRRVLLCDRGCYRPPTAAA